MGYLLCFYLIALVQISCSIVESKVNNDSLRYPKQEGVFGTAASTIDSADSALLFQSGVIFSGTNYLRDIGQNQVDRCYTVYSNRINAFITRFSSLQNESAMKKFHEGMTDFRTRYKFICDDKRDELNSYVNKRLSEVSDGYKKSAEELVKLVSRVVAPSCTSSAESKFTETVVDSYTKLVSCTHNSYWNMVTDMTKIQGTINPYCENIYKISNNINSCIVKGSATEAKSCMESNVYTIDYSKSLDEARNYMSNMNFNNYGSCTSTEQAKANEKFASIKKTLETCLPATLSPEPERSTTVATTTTTSSQSTTTWNAVSTTSNSGSTTSNSGSTTSSTTAAPT